jgi:hypothetical protein
MSVWRAGTVLRQAGIGRKIATFAAVLIDGACAHAVLRTVVGRDDAWEPNRITDPGRAGSSPTHCDSGSALSVLFPHRACGVRLLASQAPGRLAGVALGSEARVPVVRGAARAHGDRGDSRCGGPPGDRGRPRVVLAGARGRWRARGRRTGAGRGGPRARRPVRHGVRASGGGR